MRRESMLKKEVEQIDNPCFRFSSNSSLLKRIVKKKKNCPLVSKKRMLRKKHDFNMMSSLKAIFTLSI